MQKTVFYISKMDCPSEENLIRMQLDRFSSIKNLDFDLVDRKLTVFHEGQITPIEASIVELNLGAKKLTTEKTDQTVFEEANHQKALLWWVLGINLTFFFIELSMGLMSKSMGLVADSLDMLADAFVYGISLLAVGSTISRKKKIANIAGYVQLSLAIFGFLEVLRRFFGMEDLPDFSTMVVVSIFALAANAFCLYLLQKSNSKEEAHMQASMIFTSNDIIINIGVIAAAGLVFWLNSNLPDLIIGSIVFVIVTRGAFRILKLSR